MKEVHVQSWNETTALHAREVSISELTLGSHSLRGVRLPAIDLTARTDRKKAQRGKIGGHGTGDLPFFRWGVYGAREASQESALRSDERAKSAPLTRLPLRSCVASSHRKNVRKKWEPEK